MALVTDTAIPEPNIIHGEFWVREQELIEADLANYRNHHPVAFVPEPQMPEGSPIPQGKGTWILTKHADISYARAPEIFSSAQGITIPIALPNSMSSSIQ